MLTDLSFRMRRGNCATSLLLLVLAAFTVAAAPPVQDVLGNHGYVSSDYTVTLVWKECPVPGGPLYYGAHLVPNGGAPPFDVYYTDDGVLLDAAARSQAGLLEKNWNWRSVTRPSKRAPLPLKQAPDPLPAPKSPGSLVETMTLDVPDVTAALQEDEVALSAMTKGALRTGVIQELAVPVRLSSGSASLGDWTTQKDGGRLWALTLNAPGALGVRIHFEHLGLPANAQVLIYNPADPQEVYGPFGPQDDLWAPTSFGEAVTVECFVPASADSASVELTLDRVVYQYRDLKRMTKQAAACNLDVSCYPQYAEAAASVAGIGVVTTGGSYWCTGALLSDGSPSTFESYFLTADHCIASPSEANGTEFYWFFGTSTCNGAIPDLADVPRTTGGADYLAGSPGELNADPGTDMTFMRIREAVPAGVVYSGYTTGAVALGADVICIHHPLGTYKRISFGKNVDTGSPSNLGAHIMGPLSRFHEVLWNSNGGTTEPGSSGSPLFTELAPGSLYVIGQLYGGLASCTLKNEPDSFGRLDQSYSILSDWLEGEAAPEPSGGTATEGEPPVSSEGAVEGALEGEAVVEGEVNVVVQAIAPNHGAEAGGYTVQITGSGLRTAFRVWFGDTTTTRVTVQSDTSILVVVPAHPAGLVNIIVDAPSVSGALLQAFSYDSPASEGEGAAEGATEGEPPVEGEGAVEGQLDSEGEGLAEGEGSVEGEPSVEGEGALEGQPEGEVLVEGEGAVEGEVRSEGEPAVEGDVTAEGELHAEGEGLFEGETASEGDATSGPRCGVGYTASERFGSAVWVGFAFLVLWMARRRPMTRS